MSGAKSVEGDSGKTCPAPDCTHALGSLVSPETMFEGNNSVVSTKLLVVEIVLLIIALVLVVMNFVLEVVFVLVVETMMLVAFVLIVVNFVLVVETMMLDIVGSVMLSLMYWTVDSETMNGCAMACDSMTYCLPEHIALETCTCSCDPVFLKCNSTIADAWT